MSAGLSSLLLQTIAVASPQLQTLVSRRVFLKIISELDEEGVKLTTKVAYMTVATSLIEKIATSQISDPFLDLTFRREEFKSLISGIIFKNLEIDLENE